MLNIGAVFKKEKKNFLLFLVLFCAHAHMCSLCCVHIHRVPMLGGHGTFQSVVLTLSLYSINMGSLTERRAWLGLSSLRDPFLLAPSSTVGSDELTVATPAISPAGSYYVPWNSLKFIL